MNSTDLAKFSFVEYDDRGAIFGYRSVHGFPGTHNNAPGKLLVDFNPDPSKYWVSNGKLLERPVNTARLVGFTLLNVPTSSVIHVDHTRYECDSDTVTFDFPMPGTYEIEVICFPYQNKKFEVLK